MQLLLLALGLVLFQSPAAFAQDTEEITEVYEDGSPREVREVRRGRDGTPVNHGEYTSWHPNGQVAAEGRYRDGQRIGRWIFRGENGKRRETGSYREGKRVGNWRLYRAAGGLEAEGPFENDRRAGEWTFYDAQRNVDPTRSGTYRWFPRRANGTFVQGEGEVFEGRKVGPWTFWWPNGSTMATCTYVAGHLHGDLVFFRPDGTFEPDLLSGVYRAGRRVGDLGAMPEGGDAGPGPVRYADEAQSAPELIDRWLTGEEEPAIDARVQLVMLGRQAVPAILNRLVACDLAEPFARLTAQHLHVLLQDIFGGAGYLWDGEHTPEASATRGTAVLRWQIAWLALRDAPGVWTIDFRVGGMETLPPAETVLHDLPLPELLASATALPASHGTTGGGKFGGRSAPRDGADAVVAERIAQALAWLAAQQERDGRWSSERHGGYELFDVAVTAQTLLTLMADGNTPTAGPYAETVARGIAWLIVQQDATSGQIVSRLAGPKGLRTGPEPIYEHTLAVHALAEAALFARSPLLTARLQLAVDHLLGVRDVKGRWDFPGGVLTGDCAITTSVVLPLLAARDAGMAIDPAVFDDLARRLGELAGPDGMAALPTARPLAPDERRFTPDRGGDIAGAVLLARILLGQDPTTAPALIAHASRLWRHLPRWEAKNGAFDLHALHDGTYAMFQVGGEAWSQWNMAVAYALVKAQISEGEAAGTWDPIGPYGRGGGRILSTALMARTLLVHKRFARLTR